MLRAVAIPGLPKRLGGGYKPFSPEESPRGKVPPRDDPEPGEKEDEGDQPEPQEQPRAHLVVGPEAFEAGAHYTPFKRLNRLKVSRSLPSRRSRAKLSSDLLPRVTRDPTALT